jgi:hypothetical protein
MSEEWLALSLMTARSVLSALNALDRCASRLADTPSCANCVWKLCCVRPRRDVPPAGLFWEI